MSLSGSTIRRQTQYSKGFHLKPFFYFRNLHTRSGSFVFQISVIKLSSNRCFNGLQKKRKY
jgi:hypothetical protein